MKKTRAHSAGLSVNFFCLLRLTVLCLLLLLTACAPPLSWETLPLPSEAIWHRPEKEFLVVLPSPGAISQTDFSKLEAWANGHWPQAEVTTDTAFLREGGAPGQPSVIVGTPEGNLLVRKILSRLPIKLFADCIVARQQHSGDGPALWVKCPEPLFGRPYLLVTGHDLDAIMASRLDIRFLPDDYLINRGGDILERGFLRQVRPIQPLSSVMIFDSDAKLVVPETVNGKADSDYSLMTVSNVAVISDREIMSAPQLKGSILALGTPDNNHFIAQMLKYLPIRVERHRILAESTYCGENLALYAKIPYPSSDAQIRILAGTDPDQLRKYRFSFQKYNLNRFDYAIINTANDMVLEYGRLPESAVTFDLTDRQPTAKERMLKDLDLLADFVCNTFPMAEVNDLVYQVDMRKIFQQARDSITGAESPHDFFALLAQVVTACRGSHLQLFPIPNHHSGQVELVDLTDGFRITSSKQLPLIGYPLPDICKYNQYYLKHYCPPSRQAMVGCLALTYWQGNYYTQYDYIVDGIKYPRGMKLLAINGRSATEVQAELQPRLSGWDQQENRFYGLNGGPLFLRQTFYLAIPATIGQKFSFMLADSKGESRHLEYIVGQGVALFDNKGIPAGNQIDRQVTWLKQSKILYLRLPGMHDIDFYISRLRELEVPEDIRAVVIDIRLNSGGSDLVWIELLRHLLAEPAKYTFRQGRKNHPIPRGFYWVPRQLEKISYLENAEFIIQSDTWRIEPASDSLKLTVPIFILCKDVFSAAGKFMDFARGTEQITSIGEYNSLPSGESGRPEFLLLPNSRIVIMSQFLLNLTGATNPVDLFHAKPEVALDLSLEELLAYWNMDENMLLEERLIGFDPYFKKVLELLADEK